MKIALLPARTLQDSLFAPADLEVLSGLGELVRNETETVDADVVRTLAADADAVLTSWRCPAFDAALMASLDRLRVIAHAAGSVKPIVTPAVWKNGVRVSSGNGPLGVGVAETALGMTISSLKNLWRLANSASAGGWREEQGGVRELFDITIGVVGAGRAGAHYIQLLRPFEVDIVLYDPTLSAEQAAELGARKVELDELLAGSDLISIHAPSIPATHHLFNAERLRAMKDDAILINTARGSLIDEDALVAELRRGRLFACLDVTDPEPPPADHPFRTLPNCVLAGHVAGAINNGLRRLGRFAAAELRRFFADEPLHGEVVEADLGKLA